jgi:hypothetical protein
VTVTSTLLTVVLAAIGVATFATDPLVLAVTIAVALVTLTVLATRLGRTLNPSFALPTPDMLLATPEPADLAELSSADGVTGDTEAAPAETFSLGVAEPHL